MFIVDFAIDCHVIPHTNTYFHCVAHNFTDVKCNFVIDNDIKFTYVGVNVSVKSTITK